MGYRELVALAIVLLPISAGAACLRANSEAQVVEGRLTVGHARDAIGRPEKPYILRLVANACLDGEDPDEAVASTRFIHIFPGEQKLEPVFRRLIGKTVVVRGKPFAAHTAHHHAPIVMEVDEIK
jgi:uncharacterized protein DUF4431